MSEGPTIDPRLRRWQEAGLIDTETAERIQAFEDASATRRDRPGIVEAAVYLGFAVIGVGVVVLAATNWEHLQAWARIAVTGVPAVLALAVGQLMRADTKPGVRRGGMVAWLLAQALFTAMVAIIGDESGQKAENVVLAAGITALAAGLALWVAMPSHAQLLGLAAGMTFFSSALAMRAGPDDGALVLGISLALLAGGGVLMAELSFLVPQLFARLLASLGVTVGAFVCGLPPGPGWAESISFFAGACLVGLSIRRGVFIYTGMGIASLFVGLVTLILRHVDNQTVAAIDLIIVGAVLLACVLLLERFRPWRRGVAPA